MNIFVLDRDPVKAAQFLCDAHVVKMTLESAQLLCTQLRVWRDSGKLFNYDDEDWSIIYKATHINHPCRVCLESSFYNMAWLVIHFNALLDEYKYRFGRTHGSSRIAQYFGYSNNWIPHIAEKVKLPKCMPEEFKAGGDSIDDVVISYRNYYRNKAVTIKRFKYTSRCAPVWLSGDLPDENKVK